MRVDQFTHVSGPLKKGEKTRDELLDILREIKRHAERIYGDAYEIEELCRQALGEVE